MDVYVGAASLTMYEKPESALNLKTVSKGKNIARIIPTLERCRVPFNKMTHASFQPTVPLTYVQSFQVVKFGRGHFLSIRHAELCA